MNIKDFNYKSVSLTEGMQVAVIPWGSCEPHGEQLSYCTDTLLAEEIAQETILKTKNPSLFMVLPSIGYGSQNFGQHNKRYCIHFSIETQKAILRDIVISLQRHYITKILIFNGHNGNDFKSIVRDLELEFDVDIYVCNYLDAIDKEFLNNILGSKELDDHAGFTETSLMMHYFHQYVHMENLSNDVDLYEKSESSKLVWTPRNWDMYSCNTRVGDPRDATPEAGKVISDHITEKLSNELNKIIKFEI